MSVIYLFGKLHDQDIDWLTGAGTRKNVAEGRALLRQGGTVKSFYITLTGRFRVISERKLIASIVAGESVGELSFLDGRPPAATVTAAEDCVVAAFSLKRLRTKLRLDDEFASRFYHSLCIMLGDRIRRSGRLVAMSNTTFSHDDISTGFVSPSLLQDPVVGALVGAATRYTLPAGRILLTSEDVTEFLFVVLSGRFMVSLEHSPLAYIGPNEVINELSLLDGMPPNVRVTAVEDSVVASVPMDELRALLRKDRNLSSHFHHAIAMTLASRIRHSGRLVALSRRSFDDEAVDSAGRIPPMLLDDTTLAGARFGSVRRRFLEN